MRYITSIEEDVGGTRIYVDRPFLFPHLGEQLVGPDGRIIDTRGEVGLLTRNGKTKPDKFLESFTLCAGYMSQSYGG